MASKISKNPSKSFEDVDSDDFSQETSLATEFTVSPDSSEREVKQAKKRRIVKQLAQRKKLVHDMQMLRIELSQKNLAIEALKSEHVQQFEDLEERLHDLTYQRQILQARLKTEVQSEKEEARKRQQEMDRELELVKTKQQYLEAANERLLEKAGHVRQSLGDLSLSPERYEQLKCLSNRELSLRDFIAIRVYDTVHPLKTEIDNLRMTERAQDEQIASYTTELQLLKRRLEEEHMTNAELHVKLQAVSQDYVNKCAQLKSDDLKTVCYDDDIKAGGEARRRKLEADKQLSAMETVVDSLRKERDQLTKQLYTAQQSEALLKQDKEYLCRQVSEFTKRATFAEDRLQQVTQQLDDARQTREEVYEKFVSCRNLREARDTALAERQRFQLSAREANVKYEELTTQFREMRSRAESRMSETENELKVKSLKVERCQMVHEETVSNLKDRALEVELLQKKEEMLRKEYHSMQTTLEKRIVELQAQLSDRSSKLDMYERLERDLDHISVHAADKSDDIAAEKVCSIGNIPNTVKRRMEQSVQLAKRVVQLERDNSALHKDVDSERRAVSQLTDELERCKAAMAEAQQPYAQLVDGIRERDEHITQLQEHINVLKQELRKTEEEKQRLQQTQHQLSQDLKRMHQLKEDMSTLKEAVTGLSARRRETLAKAVGVDNNGDSSGTESFTPTPSPSHQQEEEDHGPAAHRTPLQGPLRPSTNVVQVLPTQKKRKTRKVASSHRSSLSRVFGHLKG
ncbi:progesterone-induced-blocking factor 1-like [Babylonia areolata]|uniref:progesterone-induced-blocking factor 1-like n=1 Tax=Babylonia areolata TaxID=304850 RepID=UPI003FCFE457